MIGDFYMKPLSRAKFCWFRNIIMNCSHDDYSPVNMDELMAAHHRTVANDDISDEPTTSTDTNHKAMSSQECVGGRTDRMWTAIKKAHQNKRKSGQQATHHTRGRGYYVQARVRVAAE